MSDTEMEFIDLQEKEEEITRVHASEYQIPIATINLTYIWLNKAATIAWGDAPYTSIACTTEYIILRQEPEKTGRTFKMGRDPDTGNLMVAIPRKLNAKKPARGAYKLLRTKGGFAFNRYAPITPAKK